MELSEIHPSHEMEYSDYGSDRHDDHNCKICHMSTCLMCHTGSGMDDDELAQECIGYSHWDDIEVEGPDGITHTVKNSGTGWPSGKK